MNEEERMDFSASSSRSDKRPPFPPLPSPKAGRRGKEMSNCNTTSYAIEF